ncbi:hypothetical protein BJ684DRAFT_20709 [Piptocephalis cylindrospora]|uniref:Uncharacterized protein n=1 Tax=Piptocephalis cylindrospora TaxID=1907219 RepID=A0A4P9Y1T7_9FUNG|nr:hypothetical protein BJ684DRAFT_20709 [Piptocephalis cylindrospora]|eukprot:RKP12767.1 hypothetical protein BJ684DRAFT_20709 [Piptocephalis cylindrospora]
MSNHPSPSSVTPQGSPFSTGLLDHPSPSTPSPDTVIPSPQDERPEGTGCRALTSTERSRRHRIRKRGRNPIQEKLKKFRVSAAGIFYRDPTGFQECLDEFLWDQQGRGDCQGRLIDTHGVLYEEKEDSDLLNEVTKQGWMREKKLDMYAMGDRDALDRHITRYMVEFVEERVRDKRDYLLEKSKPEHVSLYEASLD